MESWGDGSCHEAQGPQGTAAVAVKRRACSVEAARISSHVPVKGLCLQVKCWSSAWYYLSRCESAPLGFALPSSSRLGFVASLLQSLPVFQPRVLPSWLTWGSHSPSLWVKLSAARVVGLCSSCGFRSSSLCWRCSSFAFSPCVNAALHVTGRLGTAQSIVWAAGWSRLLGESWHS